MPKCELKSRMKNLLMFLPNMFILCAKLMVDSRVPRTERALFAGALIYAIIPFDFIPDMIPFVGQIDDLFLISLTILRLIDRTDDRVVREHWRGGGGWWGGKKKNEFKSQFNESARAEFFSCASPRSKGKKKLSRGWEINLVSKIKNRSFFSPAGLCAPAAETTFSSIMIEPMSF